MYLTLTRREQNKRAVPTECQASAAAEGRRCVISKQAVGKTHRVYILLLESPKNPPDYCIFYVIECATDYIFLHLLEVCKTPIKSLLIYCMDSECRV